MSTSERTKSPGRTTGRVLLVLGLLLVLGAGLARLVLPAVAVKYPGGPLDKTVIADGTFTLFVNPATTAPQNPPQRLPLHIERRLHLVTNDGSRAVVQEDDKEIIGPLPPQLFEQRYVMDRTSLKNQSDPRAYAYLPTNVIDRSPAYSINLPFDSGKGPYQVWKNETGSSYAFTRTGSVKRNGVQLSRYTGSLSDAPVQNYYIDQLSAQGIPKQLTPAQAAAQLRAHGADPALLAAAVLPQLDAVDRAEVTSIISQPIALAYRLDVNTSFLVEPRTGAIVGLEGIQQTLKARPDIQGVGRILAILAQPKYASNAVVRVAAGTVGRLVANPPETNIFAIDYGQTPASVNDLVSFANGRGNKIDLVKQTIPLGLLAIGVVCVLLGALLIGRGRRRGPSGSPQAPPSPRTPFEPTGDRQPTAREPGPAPGPH